MTTKTTTKEARDPRALVKMLERDSEALAFVVQLAELMASRSRFPRR